MDARKHLIIIKGKDQTDSVASFRFQDGKCDVVYSVFDMLYQGYAEQRRAYLQKHKRISEYDSENLMYSVIQEVLAEEAFSSIGCAEHVSLATLVKDYEPLTAGERKYACNPLTHVDFLLFNQMDKRPVLALSLIHI